MYMAQNVMDCKVVIFTVLKVPNQVISYRINEQEQLQAHLNSSIASVSILGCTRYLYHGHITGPTFQSTVK
ncbi:hypothetical protein BgAZ_101730 [Babesia gibsoni]|uniref:Uncharacterized protein n=1 Tax=Babesia gibsoni TaxID=33632 RepID=A0AAD8UTK2_BABGI|nr:hypothetical protein BgAZ_101730 [Babesia gibsoni]